MAPIEQFDEDENDIDEMQGEEIQIIDPVTTQTQLEEEDKDNLLPSVVDSRPEDADTTKEREKIEVIPTIQDKDGESPHVEVDVPSSEQTSSLVNLAIVYEGGLEQKPTQLHQSM